MHKVPTYLHRVPPSILYFLCRNHSDKLSNISFDSLKHWAPPPTIPSTPLSTNPSLSMLLLLRPLNHPISIQSFTYTKTNQPILQIQDCTIQDHTIIHTSYSSSLLSFPFCPPFPLLQKKKSSRTMQGGPGVGVGVCGVASSGSSNHGSISTVSKAEVVLEQDYMGMSEVSSTSKLVEEEENGDEELELGLGLGWGTGGTKVNKPTTPWGDYCRILTAKDFPSLVSSSSPTVGGTKWAAGADSVGQEIGSNMPSNQAVGWPPIPAYRMNSLSNQVKVPSEQNIVGSSNANKSFVKSNNMVGTIKNNKIQEKGGHGLSKFVKVNMDGMQIGRKVDLNAHVCYETLAQALEDMFHRPTSMNTANRPTGFQEHEVTGAASKPSKLLDGSSEFVLTYEDREGDWMLVGDVPWGMFLHTARRLRIMKTSEANGLAPRFQEKRNKQRSKPI